MKSKITRQAAKKTMNITKGRAGNSAQKGAGRANQTKKDYKARKR